VCGEIDCDDNESATHPNAEEVCDGLDNDCDGTVDEDLGSISCGTGQCLAEVTACIAGIPQVCLPGDPSDETCNVLDDDCDGLTDEDLGIATCGLGVCEHTVQVCLDGQTQACDPLAGAGQEICDGLDNDCDGEVDEELGAECDPCALPAESECISNEVRDCGSDTGVCREGVEHCVDGQWGGVCLNEILPSDEIQDGLDNDCNGEIDEGFWVFPEICPASGARLYVNALAADGGNGLSWETAFNAIQPAIDAALECDEIWIKAGSYSPAATIELDKRVQLFGGLAGDEASLELRDMQANETVVDGGATVPDEETGIRCMNISADAMIDGLTFMNCRDRGDDANGGALHIAASSLVLRNSVFRDNFVNDKYDSSWYHNLGGAIYAENSSLFVENSSFTGNLTKRRGSAVSMDNSTAIFRDSVFRNNAGQYGGGAINLDGGSSAGILGCSFEGNGKGAIRSYSNSEIIVVNSTFFGHPDTFEPVIHNHQSSAATFSSSSFTGNSGELIVNKHGSDLTVSDCEFSENSGDYGITNSSSYVNPSGGDPYWQDRPTARIDNTIFTGNRYGSILNARGDMVIVDSRFVENSGFPSPVSLINSSVTEIDSCEFIGNYPSDEGGAIGVERSAKARVSNSVFRKNRGWLRGGALHLHLYATVDLINSVLADNYSSRAGSAVYAADYSTLRMLNTTVTRNMNDNVGGSPLYLEYNSTALIENSILWGNIPNRLRSSNSSYEVYHSIVSNSILWRDEEDGNLFAEDVNTLFADDGFGLHADSAAIDAGTLTPTAPLVLSEADMVGHLRALDGNEDGTLLPDLGAHEYVPGYHNTPPVAVSGGDRTLRKNTYANGYYELNADRSCDADGDPLSYTWYGPFGQLEGVSPLVVFPEGTSTVTLEVRDGESSSTSQAEITTVPCLEVFAAVAPAGGVRLNWLPMEGALNYIVYGIRSFSEGFLQLGNTIDNEYVDMSAETEEVNLYSVGVLFEDDFCFSNIVAVSLEDQVGNHAPIIYSTPSYYGFSTGATSENEYPAMLDIPYTYDVNAVDPDRDVLHYALVEYPDGMVIDPDTGLISWLPQQPGLFNTMVEVSDSNGGLSSQSFVLRVENRPPVADAGPDIVTVNPRPILRDGGGLYYQVLNNGSWDRSVGHYGSRTDSFIVEVDGGNSFDPDGEALDYWWFMNSRPVLSSAVLSDDTAVNPSFELDAPGKYEFELFVEDPDSYSEPDTVTVSTLNNPPIAAPPSEYADKGMASDPADFYRGEIVPLEAPRSFDPDGDPFTFHWSIYEVPEGSTNVQITDPDAMVTTFIPDVKGWYLIKFVLNDGKADGWPALSFIEIGNRDPVADGGPDRTVAVGDRVDVDCYASTDPEGDALECAWWVDGPDGSLYPLYLPDGTTSTNTYGPEAYFTPDVAGTYEVRLRVTDEDGVRDGYGGVDRVTFFVTALPDNYPPEITSLPVETATQGELYEYDVAASDPDGEDALVYSLAHAPDGMDINAGTGAIQWNVLPEHLGAYDVTVRVEDPAGLSDEQSYAIAVNDVNFAPAITSSPLQSATPGLGYRYDVDASDPDPDDNLVFSLDVFPEEMHIDSLTGLILWTPGPDQVGTQTITLRVEDGSGLFDLQGFAVEVSSHAPVLTSSPISTAVEYAQYLYDVEAMDEDAGDRLRYSLDDAPAGMDINSVSGEIQWTPAARWNNGESQTGNYPVTVRVEDLGGQFDVQSFTIQVSESAPGVRISVSKDSLQIPASLTDALVYYISFETSVPAPCTLTFDQTVTPDTGGLTLGETSVSWEVETTSQRVYTQLIEAHTAGTYEITATVTESAPRPAQALRQPSKWR
jgi:hypothetical protein